MHCNSNSILISIGTGLLKLVFCASLQSRESHCSSYAKIRDVDEDDIEACTSMHASSRVTYLSTRERSGSVVECLTRDRRAAGSSLTGVTALWSLSKAHLS